MHNYRWIACLIGMLLIGQLCCPAPVTAQEDGYRETFDGSELAGWERSREASVADGVLRMTPGSFALKPGDWHDITLSLKIRLGNDSEAHIRYYFREEGMYALRLRAGELTLAKEGARLPGEQRLGEAQVPALQPDTWAEVGITVDGGDHTISVDGTPVLTATDTEPLPTGALLLEARGSDAVAFDDVEMRGAPGGPPPEGHEEPAPGESVPPEGEPGEAVPGAPVEAQATPAAQGASSARSLTEEFFASQASNLELSTFLINLLLATLCAYILSLVYIHWGASLSNRRAFASNFMLMTITTTFIILVVRSSVALSLGLVGALSIVRFRTAVKEAEELAYLFFAIGIGIGLGDNQRLITLLALATAIAIIGLRRLMMKRGADANLHLSVASHNPGKVELEQVMAALEPHATKLKLLHVEENAQTLDAAFLVEFREISHLNAARSALRALSGTIEIAFMNNKGLW